MRVVSNASVLIALAKLGAVNLLEKLFGVVMVPSSVFVEITRDFRKPGARMFREAKWINIVDPKNEALVSALLDILDEGESHAIALAKEINADLVLLDEREARRIAKRLGLRVIGTLGILILAKKEGYINQVKPLIERLKKLGFKLSDKVVSIALRLANEE